MGINKFMRLINGSKEYRFEGSVLEIVGYYTGESIKLDLSKITEETLEELIADDEEEYY